MTRKRNIGRVAAIGGLIAAVVLLTGPPAAKADEASDPQGNMQVLQQQVDQLAQAFPGTMPATAPPGFQEGYGVPPTPSGPGQPVVSGSFPRSFLIPGTDTSLRVGGIVWASVYWASQGWATGGALDGQGGVNQTCDQDGPGGACNLPNIPLNNSPAYSRHGMFQISPKVSRILFDARTPTPWGEARAYFEFGGAVNNTNTDYNTLNGVSSGWLLILRKAYGTLGGLEAGQDTGILHDPNADPETVDAGGPTGTAGRAREPQVKYTAAGPYGLVFVAGIENPVPDLTGPFGEAQIDTNAIPTSGTCPNTTQPVAFTSANVGSILPETLECQGAAAFFNPLLAPMPEFIATTDWNQPWGHIHIGGVVRNITLDDGQYLDQSYMGYGGTISGDVHPFSGVPGPLGRDDLGFGSCAGNGVGKQCLNNGGGVSTNFGGTLLVPGVGLVNPLTSSAWNARDGSQTLGASGFVNGINVRQAYDALVQTETNPAITGWIWYQHWWSDTLRSTIDISGNYNKVNASIVQTEAGAGDADNNKELALAHVNLFWSPVAFIDFGGEYAWGHRVTVANYKGDIQTLEATMRVRF
jgi:DcaP outer membrane protein/Porin subfamily